MGVVTRTFLKNVLFRKGIWNHKKKVADDLLDSVKTQYTESITVDSATVPQVISEDASHVQVTSANATYALQLPVATPGKVVTINNAANGFELWAQGTNVKINDVVCSATNEAAIPADTLCLCVCRSATEWVLTNYTKLGAVTTAIIPDSRS